ncbi:hypothetical protein AXX12_14785 [Anaerosporomusa subterranea]|uniref:DUF304 domain-containing protein n=1 Tax=Anaerosporomusa subterranea TaxID=1794912 RepID=A0A154BN99_ANASB|nr:hypothetical protein [Anaerosporomusa subterranea]KYZ75409.1 hypothetical protein AXX12_14785 [Anaerosporomusa subterranea]
MSKDSAILIETSQVHKKNRIVIGIAILAFGLLFAFSVYKWVVVGVQQPIEIFFNLMFIYVLIERAQAKYICEIGKKTIRITKKSLLGSKTYEVDYKDINGIYKYKTGLVHVVKFRRTYRLNSALDNRLVWAMAYEAPGKGGKVENHRIFFKASDELLNLLDEKMPNRVRLTEEQVALKILKK